MGEFRMDASGAWFGACGDPRVHPVVGAGLAAIGERYTAVRGSDPSWALTWLSGYPGVLRNGDTVMVALSYMHMEKEVFCDPMPNEKVVGSYLTRFNDPGGERSVRYDLFPDGTLLLSTTAERGQVEGEEDGTWGMDRNGDVVVRWADERSRRILKVIPHGLVLVGRNPGGDVVYDHDGAPHPMRGIVGKVVRWMETLSAELGTPLPPGTVQRNTALDSLFPTPEARQRLQRSVQEVLHPQQPEHIKAWQEATTVNDLVQLARALQQG